MTVAVFLGPTLSRERAEAVLDADYRPPVERGDLLRLLEQGRPEAVAIVDGRFDSVASVWHKEILLALERGVPVIGAASMGALRAAELHRFGMIGIGRVFELYRDGHLDADDEVAVAHGQADAGHGAMSDALVDIRDDCERAASEGVISDGEAAALVETAQQLFYAQRAWPVVLRQAGARGVAPRAVDAMRSFISGRGPGLKERDALELLRALRAGQLRAPDSPAPVARTTHFERLRQDVRLAVATGRRTAPGDSVVLSPGTSVAQVEQQAMLRVLARQAAAALDLEITDEDAAAVRRRFCERRGLASDGELRAWLAQRGVGSEVFEAYVEDLTRLHLLAYHHSFDVRELLPDEVRLAPEQPSGRHRLRDLSPQQLKEVAGRAAGDAVDH